jgi:hypothetical protein
MTWLFLLALLGVVLFPLAFMATGLLVLGLMVWGLVLCFRIAFAVLVSINVERER